MTAVAAKMLVPSRSKGVSEEAGKTARRSVPRTSHGEWAPALDRPDPVALLESQAPSRVPELVPIRYGRMLASPFAFYRGAAIVMANDLSPTPSSGFNVQLCGDAHAANFGTFASPEREMLFDVNDFDETLPGPWEWDLKRLVASLAVAGRYRSFSDKERQEVVTRCSAAYRTAMREFAGMGNLAVWYARIDTDVVQRWRGQLAQSQVRRVEKQATKARSKDSARALANLTYESDGEIKFRSEPPLLVPIEELAPGARGAQLREGLHSLLKTYERSLRPELKYLLDGYQVVDMAQKVVGVGSVGLRAWVVLLAGSRGDPLVLQAKEAQASVLEPFVGKSKFKNHGQRVVVGQRAMQAASDIFLGWVHTSESVDGLERDFYLRQLWDWKGSVDLQVMVPNGMRVYGELCAWALARAHARSGDPVAIASYAGSSSTLDLALGRFAERYADQNELDFAELSAAVADGRIIAKRET